MSDQAASSSFPLRVTQNSFPEILVESSPRTPLTHSSMGSALAPASTSSFSPTPAEIRHPSSAHTPASPVPPAGKESPAAFTASAFSRGAGRFAPSPTGDLHVGNLRTAILAWLWARLTGRAFYLRIEDIDRVRAGSTQRQIEDLQAIGLTWDGDPLIQTSRHLVHQEAVADLLASDLAFECYCSRKDIREASSAPHGHSPSTFTGSAEGTTKPAEASSLPPGHYPGTCLDLTPAQRKRKREELAALGRKPALRLRAPSATWTIHDDLHGQFTGAVDHFVIQRADGIPAYNLAVVLDDAFQGVDQVTRGDDLLTQAPGQAALASVLGVTQPHYVHVPLALNTSGDRLAKRDGAVTLPDLQALGWTVENVVEWIAASLGVPGCRCLSEIHEAIGTFDNLLEILPREAWVVEAPTALPM